jgi:hypothetical protein
MARAPSPARVAKRTRSQVVSALGTARRHHVEAKADALLTTLRAAGLRQPVTTEAAFAAVVVGQLGVITAFNEQITQLEEVVAENFGRHPAADIYLSQPASGSSSRRAPSASSGTTRSDSTTPGRRGSAAPDRARSPEPRARSPSSWPGTPPTVASMTLYISRRTQRLLRRQERRPTTTRCVPERSVTTPPSDS